jgi:hypothetical protein
MPTFDYASLRDDDVGPLLDETGASATLRQRTASGADAWEPTITDTDTACVILFDEYADKERDGTLIKERDRRVYIKAASLAVTPDTGDQLVVSGVTYSLYNVKQIAPGGVAILYEATARL